MNVLGVIGVGGASTPFYPKPWPLVSFVVGISALIAGAVREHVVVERYRADATRARSLQNELEVVRTNIYAETRDRLRELTLSLGLDNDDRVTVYENIEGSLYRVARYSGNPRFYERTGRAFYPTTEGVPMQAWQHRRSVIRDLPDPKTQPQKYYARLRNEQGIPTWKAARFVMKSRNLAGFRIEQPEGMDHYGVVVFESLRPRAFGRALLTRMRQQADGLREPLEHARSTLRTQQSILNKGF